MKITLTIIMVKIETFFLTLVHHGESLTPVIYQVGGNTMCTALQYLGSSFWQACHSSM